MFWKEFSKKISPLREFHASPHFNVYYNHRNPKGDMGVGPGGVRNQALISCYVDALERLHSAMTGPHFSRSDPTNGQPTKVYVCDLRDFQNQPFTDLDADLRAFIALPCRTDEPTLDAERQYAATSAVHEATHVFNHALRPMQESLTWRWFDEATAVFMESHVFAGNHDHLRFAMNWSDEPEGSLDLPGQWYSAGLFAAYLAKLEEPQVLTEIWQYPDKKASALDAIADFFRKSGKQFSSDNPKDTDLIFSQYCVDSYFLWDMNGFCFLPDVHARYGGRAVTESLSIKKGKLIQPQQREGYRLNHLACRYFLLDLEHDVQSITVKVKARARKGRTFLKAVLASAPHGFRRGERWNLVAKNTGSDFVEFITGPVGLNHRDLDHLVLVVSNCGYSSPLLASDSPVDNVQFFIEIQSE